MPAYSRFRPLKQWGRYNAQIMKEQYIFKRREAIPPFKVPKELLLKGIDIYDPNDPTFPRDRRPPPVEINHPAVLKVDKIEDHALYHAKPCFLHDGTKSLAEGLNHALALTKSVLRSGLPTKLVTDANIIELPEAHDANMEHIVLHSQQFDSEMEKLPRRFDHRLFWYRWPRYFGISRERRCELLLDDLLRYSLRFSRNFPQIRDLVPSRKKVVNGVTGLNNEEDILCVRQRPYLSLLTPYALTPVLKGDKIAATSSEQVPDVWPILPTLDLKPEHLFSDEAIYPKDTSAIPYCVHTIMDYHVQDQKYPWNESERSANLVVKTFGAALAVAKRKYGFGLKGDLEEPIVAQGIQFTASSFDFVVFQLNTLNLDGKEGIKNVAWVDSGNKLFESKDRYWENMKKVKGLDGNVFRKFLALLMNSSPNPFTLKPLDPDDK